jgi:hypothetical protein
MREPANKRMLTDVSGFRSYHCTIIKLPNSLEFPERTLQAASNLDKGHKRMRAGDQYRAFPGVLGNGIASRTLARPVT